MQLSQVRNVGLPTSTQTKRDIPAWTQDPKIFPLDWFSISRPNLILQTKAYVSELSKWRNCSKIKTLSKLKAVMKRIMMFLHTHMTYIFEESLLECDLEEDLIALVSLYTDMELRVLVIKKSGSNQRTGCDSSTEANGNSAQNDKQIIDRILYWLYTILPGHEQRLDALLSITTFSKRTRAIMDPIFRKVLNEMSDGPFSHVNYVRHMLTYKVWRERVLVADDAESTTLRAQILQYLIPRDYVFPPPLLRSLGKGKTAREHARPHNLNLADACRNFINNCRKIPDTTDEEMNFESILLLDDDMEDEENEVNNLMQMITDRKQKKLSASSPSRSTPQIEAFIDLTVPRPQINGFDPDTDIIDLTEEDEKTCRTVQMLEDPTPAVASTSTTSVVCTNCGQTFLAPKLSTYCFEITCLCPVRHHRCLKCQNIQKQRTLTERKYKQDATYMGKCFKLLIEKNNFPSEDDVDTDSKPSTSGLKIRSAGNVTCNNNETEAAAAKNETNECAPDCDCQKLEHSTSDSDSDSDEPDSIMQENLVNYAPNISHDILLQLPSTSQSNGYNFETLDKRKQENIPKYQQIPKIKLLDKPINENSVKTSQHEQESDSDVDNSAAIEILCSELKELQCSISQHFGNELTKQSNVLEDTYVPDNEIDFISGSFDNENLQDYDDSLLSFDQTVDDSNDLAQKFVKTRTDNLQNDNESIYPETQQTQKINSTSVETKELMQSQNEADTTSAGIDFDINEESIDNFVNNKEEIEMDPVISCSEIQEEKEMEINNTEANLEIVEENVESNNDNQDEIFSVSDDNEEETIQELLEELVDNCAENQEPHEMNIDNEEIVEETMDTSKENRLNENNETIHDIIEEIIKNCVENEAHEMGEKTIDSCEKNVQETKFNEIEIVQEIIEEIIKNCVEDQTKHELIPNEKEIFETNQITDEIFESCSEPTKEEPQCSKILEVTIERLIEPKKKRKSGSSSEYPEEKIENQEENSEADTSNEFIEIIIEQDNCSEQDKAKQTELKENHDKMIEVTIESVVDVEDKREIQTNALETNSTVAEVIIHENPETEESSTETVTSCSEIPEENELEVNKIIIRERETEINNELIQEEIIDSCFENENRKETELNCADLEEINEITENQENKEAETTEAFVNPIETVDDLEKDKELNKTEIKFSEDVLEEPIPETELTIETVECKVSVEPKISPELEKVLEQIPDLTEPVLSSEVTQDCQILDSEKLKIGESQTNEVQELQMPIPEAQTETNELSAKNKGKKRRSSIEKDVPDAIKLKDSNSLSLSPKRKRITSETNDEQLPDFSQNETFSRPKEKLQEIMSEPELISSITLEAETAGEITISAALNDLKNNIPEETKEDITQELESDQNSDTEKPKRRRKQNFKYVIKENKTRESLRTKHDKRKPLNDKEDKQLLVLCKKLSEEEIEFLKKNLTDGETEGQREKQPKDSKEKLIQVEDNLKIGNNGLENNISDDKSLKKIKTEKNIVKTANEEEKGESSGQSSKINANKLKFFSENFKLQNIDNSILQNNVEIPEEDVPLAFRMIQSQKKLNKNKIDKLLDSQSDSLKPDDGLPLNEITQKSKFTKNYSKFNKTGKTMKEDAAKKYQNRFEQFKFQKRPKPDKKNNLEENHSVENCSISQKSISFPLKSCLKTFDSKRSPEFSVPDLIQTVMNRKKSVRFDAKVKLVVLNDEGCNKSLVDLLPEGPEQEPVLNSLEAVQNRQMDYLMRAEQIKMQKLQEMEDSHTFEERQRHVSETKKTFNKIKFGKSDTSARKEDLKQNSYINLSPKKIYSKKAKEKLLSIKKDQEYSNEEDENKITDGETKKVDFVEIVEKQQSPVPEIQEIDSLKENNVVDNKVEEKVLNADVETISETNSEEIKIAVQLNEEKPKENLTIITKFQETVSNNKLEESSDIKIEIPNTDNNKKPKNYVTIPKSKLPKLKFKFNKSLSKLRRHKFKNERIETKTIKKKVVTKNRKIVKLKNQRRSRKLFKRTRKPRLQNEIINLNSINNENSEISKNIIDLNKSQAEKTTECENTSSTLPNNKFLPSVDSNNQTEELQCPKIDTTFAEMPHKPTNKIYEKQFDVFSEDDISNSELIIDTSAESSEAEEEQKNSKNQNSKESEALSPTSAKFSHRVVDIVNLNENNETSVPETQATQENSFENISVVEDIQNNSEPKNPEDFTCLQLPKQDKKIILNEYIEEMDDFLDDTYSEFTTDEIPLKYAETQIQMHLPAQELSVSFCFAFESSVLFHEEIGSACAKESCARSCVRGQLRDTTKVIECECLTVEENSEELLNNNLVEIPDRYCHSVETYHQPDPCNNLTAVVQVAEILTNENRNQMLDNYNLFILADTATNSVHLNTRTENNNVIEDHGHIEKDQRCFVVTFPNKHPSSEKPIENYSTFNNNNEKISVDVEKLSNKNVTLENAAPIVIEPVRKSTKGNRENWDELCESLEEICKMEINTLTKTPKDIIPTPVPVEIPVIQTRSPEPNIPMDIPNTALLHLTPDDDDFPIRNLIMPPAIVEPVPSTSKASEKSDLDLGVVKNLINVIASITDEDKSTEIENSNSTAPKKPEPKKSKVGRPKTSKTSYLLNKYKSTHKSVNSNTKTQTNTTSSSPQSYIRSTKPMRMVTTRKRNINMETTTSELTNKASASEKMFDKLLEEHKKELSEAKLKEDVNKVQDSLETKLPDVENDNSVATNLETDKTMPILDDLVTEKEVSTPEDKNPLPVLSDLHSEIVKATAVAEEVLVPIIQEQTIEKIPKIIIQENILLTLPEQTNEENKSIPEENNKETVETNETGPQDLDISVSTPKISETQESFSGTTDDQASSTNDRNTAIEVVQDWFNRVENKRIEPYSEIPYQTIEECNFFEEISNTSEDVRKTDDKPYNKYQTPDSGIAFDEDSVQKDKSLTPVQETSESESETSKAYFQSLEQEVEITDLRIVKPSKSSSEFINMKVSIALDRIKEIIPVLTKQKMKKRAPELEKIKKRKHIDETVTNASEAIKNKRKKVEKELFIQECAEEVVIAGPSHKETTNIKTKGSVKEYPDCLFGITQSPVPSGSFNSPYPSDISLTEEPTFYEEGGIDLCNDYPCYDSFEVLQEQQSIQREYNVDDNPKDVQQGLQAGYCVVDNQFLPLSEYMNDGEYILIDNQIFDDKRMMPVNMHQVQPETKPHSEEVKRNEFEDSEKEDNLSETVEEIIKNPNLFNEQTTEVEVINMDQATSEVQVVIESDSQEIEVENNLFDVPIPIETSATIAGTPSTENLQNTENPPVEQQNSLSPSQFSNNTATIEHQESIAATAFEIEMISEPVESIPGPDQQTIIVENQLEDSKIKPDRNTHEEPEISDSVQDLNVPSTSYSPKPISPVQNSLLPTESQSSCPSSSSNSEKSKFPKPKCSKLKKSSGTFIANSGKSDQKNNSFKDKRKYNYYQQKNSYSVPKSTSVSNPNNLKVYPNPSKTESNVPLDPFDKLKQENVCVTPPAKPKYYGSTHSDSNFTKTRNKKDSTTTKARYSTVIPNEPKRPHSAHSEPVTSRPAYRLPPSDPTYRSSYSYRNPEAKVSSKTADLKQNPSTSASSSHKDWLKNETLLNLIKTANTIYNKKY